MGKTVWDNCSLLVCSCDKYQTAWYPYFELIKKFWPDHPPKIYLNTETKSYSCDGLDIITINSKQDITWSQRLYNCLEKIDTKYIIFSLEDFFLLGPVRQKEIDRCMEWMEEDESIAVCRLYVSTYDSLKESWKTSGFRVAGGDTPYRLDTQAALWNRETLMSFIDVTESPWQFEEKGAKRIQDSDKIFLWLYSDSNYDISKMIFPYRMFPKYGYGIAWGRWLWNNRKWFEYNGISCVDYRKLDTLSEAAVKCRFKYLYVPHPKGIKKIIRSVYKAADRAEKICQNIRIYGFIEGVSISKASIRK